MDNLIMTGRLGLELGQESPLVCAKTVKALAWSGLRGHLRTCAHPWPRHSWSRSRAKRSQLGSVGPLYLYYAVASTNNKRICIAP